MKALSCPAKAGVGHVFQCGFVATDDDSSGVAYTINWGDGKSTRVPGSGWIQPGKAAADTHVYSSVRNTRVTVLAVDNTSRKSKAMSSPVQVLRDVTPPDMRLIDPSFGMLYKGCQIRVPYEASTAVVSQKVCISADVTDDVSGISGLWVYIDGRLKGIWRKDNGRFRIEVPVHGPTVGVTIRIEAWDNAGNVTTKTVTVDVLQ